MRIHPAKKRGLSLLALCTAFITAGSLLIGCAPLSTEMLQKPISDASLQVVSSQEAISVSSEPEKEVDLVEEHESPSESMLNDIGTDTLLELEKVFERIMSDSTAQYPGGAMAWPAPKAEHIITPMAG
ncbi:hypothetical protein [Marasmitruncus massiliensis]|uniref:hypothetical protein n=1 Tax=Marasmitruncus massiliensis TaxID=1944642 RepID=UPI000C7A01A3|nr:hypothetical protein [Marasmitruncus massiliensis]